MDLMTYLLATQNGGGGSDLPEVTSADNGKVLKVKDGVWNKGDDVSGDNLPPVSSADNGKILKVIDAEWNIGRDEGDRLPVVTSADEGKALIVNDQGIWDKSILPNTAEPVVKTKTQYNALSQSQKEDPTKIYFIDPDTFDSGIARVSGADSHITASQEYRPAWNAFTNDVHTPGSDDTGWCSTNTTEGKSQWLKYHFDTTTTINKVKFSTFSRNNNSWSGNVYIEGSNDNTDWENILLEKEYVSVSVGNKSAEAVDYVEFCNGNSYNYFRIRFTAYNNYSLCFQRVDISSSVIEYAAIYYMDSKYSDLTPPTKELPKVTSADNGKILKVTNGAWAKGDAPSGLPEVTAADEGKILEVNSSGEWDKGDIPESYVALTQAEYDALPSSKLTDGKMYCITDQDGNVVTQSPSTTDADYEVLFSGTDDNTERIEGTKKSDGFLYNPSKKSITIGSRQSNTTIGSNSFGFGNLVTANGSCSHAEGGATTASGDYSHAEGGSTTASGLTSHAEGSQTTASGDVSHAEGNITAASGDYSHAEGFKTTASGNVSHAEGSLAVASGNISHAEGLHTIAQRKSQHVFGEYNILDTTGADGSVKGNYIEIVGNGTNDNSRSNARTLDWSGNEWIAGTYTNGSSRKIKTNIESLTNTEALKILDLNPVKFDFIKTETNDQRERGFIAEEVMNVIPQIAFEEETDNEGNITKPASLNYIGLIPYLVKMIQIQQQEIDKLKEQINN